MNTVTQVRPRRQATPERWQAALTRAIANGIRVYQESTTGLMLATSASKPGVIHATDGITCGCEAALANDPVCQHRAMFWHLAGVLDLDPEPTPAAPIVALPRRCAVVEVLNADGRLAYRSDDLAAKHAA